MPFNNNDIQNLLCKGSSATGEYDFDTWKVSTSDEQSDDLRRLVSIHESLHSQLNVRTAYGTILQCDAFLNKNLRNSVQVKNRLNNLIERARKTHECYATFLSVLVLANTENKYNPNPESFLQGNLLYTDFYRFIKKMCRPFEGAYLQYHTCVSVIRVCMQSYAIHNYLKEDLNTFSISKIEASDFPDERLNYLSTKINNTFWEEIWEDAKIKFNAHNGIQLIIQHERTPENSFLYREASKAENDDLSDNLMKHFQLKLSELLIKGGYRTLGYNEHIKLSTKCIERCYELVPIHKASYELNSAEKIGDSTEMEILADFENEQYEVVKEKRFARIFPLYDKKNEKWANPICDTSGNHHFFFISRLLSRLLDQYDFGDNFSWDEDTLDEILYFFRRSKVVEGIRLVELYIVNTPQQLTEFLSETVKDIPVYANITMRTFASIYHMQTWYPILKDKTTCTSLFDLSPFLNFSEWKKQKNVSVFYNLIALKIDNTHHNCFVCSVGNEDSVLFITPCSAYVGNALVYNLINNFGEKENFKRDKLFIDENARTLNLTLSHLIREENYFDFKATIKNKHDNI